MKMRWVSFWLCLPLTITFGLQCAAVSEALLGTHAQGHAVSRIIISKHQQQVVAARVSQREREPLIKPSQGMRQHADLFTLRGGANGDNNENSGTKAWTKKPLFRELLAETIGTFLIVQIGTAAVMSAVYTNSLVGLFQIASVWIIAVTVAICTTASISGAHLNPAISVCLFPYELALAIHKLSQF